MNAEPGAAGWPMLPTVGASPPAGALVAARPWSPHRPHSGIKPCSVVCAFWSAVTRVFSALSACLRAAFAFVPPAR